MMGLRTHSECDQSHQAFDKERGNGADGHRGKDELEKLLLPGFRRACSAYRIAKNGTSGYLSDGPGRRCGQRSGKRLEDESREPRSDRGRE